MSKPVATAPATATADPKVEPTASPVVDPKVADPAVPAPAVVEPVVVPDDKVVDPAAPAAPKEEPKVEDPAATTKVDPPAVPEKYKLEIPADSKLGASEVAKIEALAKEKGWSNERAQEALNERSAWESEREQSHSETLSNLHDKVWLEQLQADKEVGGQAFDQNAHLAGKALERFLKKDELEALTAMKLNRQPILFKLACRIGKAMESDKAIINNPGAASLPKEQQLYPSMFKNKES